MREDIVGMLKNAIDHGGNPQRVAQSLINSGYPIRDVKEALDYVVKNSPEAIQNLENQKSQSSQSMQVQQPSYTQSQQSMPRPPQYNMPPVHNHSHPPYQSPQTQPVNSLTNSKAMTSSLKPLKPLPAQKVKPSSNGKIILLIAILILLIAALASVIIFKDAVLDLLSL